MGRISSTILSRCSSSAVVNFVPLLTLAMMRLDSAGDKNVTSGNGGESMESTAENKSAESRDDVTSTLSHHLVPNQNVARWSFFRHKFVSPGQPVRGVYQDSQICDKNHKFATV